MSFRFNHLNVPDQWNQYFTKYPQGYTILEALLNWVQQVDDMVDNQNQLNTTVEGYRTELDEFINRFDPRLQEEVTKILSEWQESGFLDIVIDQALQTQIDDVAAQLAQVATNIMNYPKQEGEGNGAWINRVISVVNTSGGKSLTLERDLTYEIEQTISIPYGFTLDLNGSMVTLNEITNIDMFEISSYTGLKNGRLKIYNPNFDKSVLKFMNVERIEQGNYDNLKIEGWWNGALLGTAIDLHGQTPNSVYIYNSFSNIAISSFEYGVRFRLSKELNPDNTGAWINAQRFDKVRFANCKYFIHMDGDYWRDNYRSETSGNIFKNLELQMNDKTKVAITVTGNLNEFDGVLWDEGFLTLGEDYSIICNEKAMNNVFNFPFMMENRQKVDTNKNIIRNHYRMNYGNPTNFNRYGLPYASGFNTFNGNQDDWLAYADKRFAITWLDGTPQAQAPTNMFYPNGAPSYWTGQIPNQPTKFEITSKFVDGWLTNFIQSIGIVFDAIPKTLKITLVTTNGEQKAVIDETNCTQKFYLGNNTMNGNIKRIIVEMTANSSGSMGIVRLFATANTGEGQTYIKKGGDVIYGDIEFPQGAGVIIRDQSGARRRLVFNDDGTINAPKI